MPLVLGYGIQPDALLIGRAQTLQPNGAWLFVPVLHTAARLNDFIRRHGGVSDDHHFVVVAEFMHHIMQRCSLIVTPDVVFPDVVVEKVMEVEVLEVLELASGRREQLFAHLYMGIHGSTYVKEQEDLHSVVPLWNHLDIEQPSIFRCGADRILKIELVCRARARKLSQSTKRDFNVPSANFDTVIEVFKAKEGEINIIKTIIDEIAKDIALVRFLKIDSDLHFINMT